MAVIDPPTHQPPFGSNALPNDVKGAFVGAPITANPVGGGLAYYPHQRSYEGSPLTSVTNSVIQFRAMRAGTIQNIYLWVSQVTGSGTAFYNILKNGAPVFSGASRMQVTSLSTAVIKEGLSISVSRGDMLTLELEEIPSGQIHYGPISFLVETL